MTEHPAAPAGQSGPETSLRALFDHGVIIQKDRESWGWTLDAALAEAREAERKEVLDEIDGALPVAYGADQADYKSEVSAILDSLSTDTREETQP